jgi:hypothetical protein
MTFRTALSSLQKAPPWAVAIVSLVVGVLVGHLLWVSPPEPPPPLKPVPLDLHQQGRYVALGDSYSAGEGLAPWEPGTEDSPQGDRCHRSAETSYPLLLTFVFPTETVLRACSGAVVTNVYDEVQRHSGVEDYQGLQAVADQGDPPILGPDVLLVTMTMGGNDVDFAKALRFCFEQSDCAHQPYTDKGSPTLAEWVDQELADLGPHLAAMYERVRADAPNARIVVLGYPPLFPEQAPPLHDLHSAVCKAAFNAFTSGEREFIREAGFALNSTIASAAHKAGVEFVDPTPFFAGHEPCGENGEWVRFVDSVQSGAIRDGSFHPLEVGQQMFARILSCHVYLFDPDTPETIETAYAMTGCVSSELVKVSPAPALTATPTASSAPTVSPAAPSG